MPKPTKVTIVIENDDGSYRVIEKIKEPPPKREPGKGDKPHQRKRPA